MQAEKLAAEGISAAKAAQQARKQRQSTATTGSLRAHARKLLMEAVEQDETNVQAWLWLSTVVDTPEDRLTCLKNVLALEPDNVSAQKGLAMLQQQGIQISPPPGSSPGQAVCPFCNQPISSTGSTCPHCQTPLIVECPECRTLMDIDIDTCTECGFFLGDYGLEAVYFYDLAVEYQARNRTDHALAALQAAEQLNPDIPDLYRLMGEVQAQLGQTSAAIASLEQAIEQEPDHVGPYLALGRVYQQEGQWEIAEEKYRQAISVYPKSSEAYFVLGDLFLQRNKLRRARKHLQKAIKLDSRHGLAWAQLGQLDESGGNYGAAAHAYQTALRYLPRESAEYQQVQERLKYRKLRAARSWSAFVGRLLASLVVYLGAVGLAVWLTPRSPQITDGLALAAGLLGTVLWVSGYSLPQNPLICAFVGSKQGLQNLSARGIMAFIGAIVWVGGLAFILYPLLQTLVPGIIL